LLDAEFKGKPRKLLAQASRNGFYFLLDRTNGQYLAGQHLSIKRGPPDLTRMDGRFQSRIQHPVLTAH